MHSSSQEMLSKYLLNSFNKNFVIRVLHAQSLVHCRHSLSIYAILKEAHGQWELRENEHLEQQRVFFMNAKRSKRAGECRVSKIC